MFVNSDFSNLLRLFNDSGARYLVIGGYAVIFYRYFQGDSGVRTSFRRTQSKSGT